MDALQCLNCRSKIGLQAQSFIELSDGVIQATRGEVGVGEVHTGFNVGRVVTNRLFEFGDGVGDFAETAIGGAEIIVKGGIFGHAFDSFLKSFDGFAELVFGHEQIAEIIVGIAVLGKDAQGFEVMFFGVFGFTQPGQGNCEVVMQIFLLRGEGDRLFKLLGGLSKVSLGEQ